MEQPGKPGRKVAPSAPAPGRPQCPEDLDRIARREWTRLKAEFKSLGLGAIDTPIIAAYCQAYSRWRAAAKTLNADGMTYATETGFIRPRPEIQIEMRYMALTRQLGAEIGVTPAARTRIDVPDSPDDGERADVFGERRDSGD